MSGQNHGNQKVSIGTRRSDHHSDPLSGERVPRMPMPRTRRCRLPLTWRQRVKQGLLHIGEVSLLRVSKRPGLRSSPRRKARPRRSKHQSTDAVATSQRDLALIKNKILSSMDTYQPHRARQRVLLCDLLMHKGRLMLNSKFNSGPRLALNQENIKPIFKSKSEIALSGSQMRRSDHSMFITSLSHASCSCSSSNFTEREAKYGAGSKSETLLWKPRV